MKIYSQSQELLDLLDQKFARIESLRKTVSDGLIQNAEKIEQQVKSLSVKKHEWLYSDFLNKTREAELSQLDEKLHQKLSVINSKSKFQVLCEEKEPCVLKQNENILEKLDLLGRIEYQNEFTALKRLKYLNFYSRVYFVSIADFKIADKYKPISIRLISLDRVFYHFKSLDNMRDLLVITNRHGVAQSHRVINENKHVNFAEYMVNDKFIVGVVSDFAHDKHRLSLFDMNLSTVAERHYDRLICLILVNESELVLFVPSENVVLEVPSLNVVKRIALFNQCQQPFYLNYFSGMVGTCEKNFYFRMSDHSANKLFVIVIDRVTGALTARIEINKYEQVRVCYDQSRKAYLVKKVDNSIDCIDVDGSQNGTALSKTSDIFNNLMQMEVSSSDRFYSINFKTRRIFVF
jgi:hypothetical protein